MFPDCRSHAYLSELNKRDSAAVIKYVDSGSTAVNSAVIVEYLKALVRTGAIAQFSDGGNVRYMSQFITFCAVTGVISCRPICLALLAQDASALSVYESMCMWYDTSMLLQSRANISMHSCFSELTLFNQSQHGNYKASSKLRQAQSC